MPSGPRVRDNNCFGTVSDNPLSSGAVTLNSAGLANMSVVSSAHAIIVLDPLRSAGAPEIVTVTAHSSSATSATITRGQFGTMARAHAQGVLWVHAPTIDDVIRICTAATRPSDPYEGQPIFETDTDSLKLHDGSAWEHGLTIGAWTSYTPTLTATITPPTLGTAAVQTGRYMKVGRTILGRVFIRFGTAGVAAGSGNYIVSLPVAARSAAGSTDTIQTLGAGAIFDDSAVAYFLIEAHAPTAGGTITNLAVETATLVTDGSPFTWAANDFISFNMMYEAAA